MTGSKLLKLGYKPWSCKNKTYTPPHPQKKKIRKGKTGKEENMCMFVPGPGDQEMNAFSHNHPEAFIISPIHSPALSGIYGSIRFPITPFSLLCFVSVKCNLVKIFNWHAYDNSVFPPAHMHSKCLECCLSNVSDGYYYVRGRVLSTLFFF